MQDGPTATMRRANICPPPPPCTALGVSCSIRTALGKIAIPMIRRLRRVIIVTCYGQLRPL